MINPLQIIRLPEYLFAPRQVITRLKREFVKPREFEVVRLPWGADIRVRPNEVIGAHLWFYGIFDLPVAEAIWRLMDEGETALDIGANIGQMTLLMQHRAGPQGHVISFEAHPEIFNELTHNVSRSPSRCKVDLHQIAVSDYAGHGSFDVGPEWQSNRGMGRMVDQPGACERALEQVPVSTLDRLLANDVRVGVCKIDIEGHECRAFSGALGLLKAGRIRDIVYEDFGDGKARQFLEKLGFASFALTKRFSQVSLQPVSQHRGFDPVKEGCNYLATRDPDRAVARFQTGGWQVLRRRSA